MSHSLRTFSVRQVVFFKKRKENKQSKQKREENTRTEETKYGVTTELSSS